MSASELILHGRLEPYSRGYLTQAIRETWQDFELIS